MRGILDHTFSVSIRASLMLKRVGLDVITLVVGDFVSNGLTVKPGTLKTLLSELQEASIVAGDLSIGFGPDHLVQIIMQESYQDPNTPVPMANCICLCSALSVCYDSFFASNVLNELFTIMESSPDLLRPSLKEWGSLLDAFEGCLAWSAFPVTLHRLERIVSSRPMTTRFEGRQLPTKPKNLAKAIAKLADISTGRVPSYTFTGGPDCAWLAAVAECILGLSVAILCEQNTLYQTHPNPGIDHQVIILRSKDRTDKISQGEVLGLSQYDIPHGRPLLWASDSTRDNPRNRISSWSTILCDTFGSRLLDSLLHLSAGVNFAKLLRSAILYPEHHPLSRLNLAEGSHSQLPSVPKKVAQEGRLFLKFVRDNLPELYPCLLGYNENTQETMMPPIAFYSALTATCSCEKCSDSQRSHAVTNDICLATMAYTIVSYAWLLFPVSMDRRTLPSITGLEQLYLWTSIFETVGEHGIQDHLKRDFHTINTLLTGRIAQPIGVGSTELARADNGICIFMRFLEDLTTPSQFMEIKIVPGSIFYRNCKYLLLEDTESGENYGSAFRQDCCQQPRGQQKSPAEQSDNSTFHFRIEETADHGVLQASCETTDTRLALKRIVSILDVMKPFSLGAYEV